MRIFRSNMLKSNCLHIYLSICETGKLFGLPFSYLQYIGWYLQVGKVHLA